MEHSDLTSMQQLWERVSDPASGQGLYLSIKGEEFIDLSIAAVHAYANEFWNNPSQLSESTKDDLNFRPCPVCSHFGKRILCQAIQPILPLVNRVDHYLSFDETIACYKDDKGEYHIAKTSLQRALQFVIQMGLINFCDVGQQYKHWFFGAHPLMTPSEIAKRVYLNLFWFEKGNIERIQRETTAFAQALKITIACQIARIKLVAKSDALVNALVNFDMVGRFLNLKAEKELLSEFSPFVSKS